MTQTVFALWTYRPADANRIQRFLIIDFSILTEALALPAPSPECLLDAVDTTNQASHSRWWIWTESSGDPGACRVSPNCTELFCYSTCTVLFVCN